MLSLLWFDDDTIKTKMYIKENLIHKQGKIVHAITVKGVAYMQSISLFNFSQICNQLGCGSRDWLIILYFKNKMLEQYEDAVQRLRIYNVKNKISGYQIDYGILNRFRF